MTYQAPVDDIMVALEAAAGLDALIADGTVTVDKDTVRAVIEEAGKFATEVLDPLSVPGDRAGSRLVDGKVVTPDGWKDAYGRFIDGGWAALPAPEAVRRPGPARGRGARRHGDLERRQPLLLALPAADAGSHRRHRRAWLRRAQAHLPAEDGVG